MDARQQPPSRADLAASLSEGSASGRNKTAKLAERYAGRVGLSVVDEVSEWADGLQPSGSGRHQGNQPGFEWPAGAGMFEQSTMLGKVAWIV